MNVQTLVRQKQQDRIGTARPQGEDQQLIRAAGRLARELHKPNLTIYMADLTLSAVIGWGALFLAIASSTLAATLGFGLVAVLALYRGVSFIHELSHLDSRVMRNFRLYWNLVVGIPVLIPSFMYEGVHNLHHVRTRYGTDRDPEYLPLAHMGPAKIATFVLGSALVPIGLLVRYALLSPLSLLLPSLRGLVVERYSSLIINPAFRRAKPEGEAARSWTMLETLTSLYAMGWIALVATGVVPFAWLATLLLVISGIAVINQLRTLGSHLWENEGEQLSVTEQYLDSVNVPPPSILSAIWAPVGLRYHAIHHLLPSVPYHNLGKAHRALMADFPEGSTYRRANYGGRGVLRSRLIRRSMSQRAD